MINAWKPKADSTPFDDVGLRSLDLGLKPELGLAEIRLRGERCEVGVAAVSNRTGDGLCLIFGQAGSAELADDGKCVKGDDSHADRPVATIQTRRALSCAQRH
ncbi:hypothetical protein [Methylobacterium sp. J-048]|uniref:hypothetical protein n=1 Tax=Methylobacterium sp. J-048 TaxID=2836635 RepID=UPI001FBA74FF|nr:hypothetical protein [Methylobacterium sp. J-048]